MRTNRRRSAKNIRSAAASLFLISETDSKAQKALRAVHLDNMLSTE